MTKDLLLSALIAVIIVVSAYAAGWCWTQGRLQGIRWWTKRTQNRILKNSSKSNKKNG